MCFRHIQSTKIFFPRPFLHKKRKNSLSKAQHRSSPHSGANTGEKLMNLDRDEFILRARFFLFFISTIVKTSFLFVIEFTVTRNRNRIATLFRVYSIIYTWQFEKMFRNSIVIWGRYSEDKFFSHFKRVSSEGKNPFSNNIYLRYVIRRRNTHSNPH